MLTRTNKSIGIGASNVRTLGGTNWSKNLTDGYYTLAGCVGTGEQAGLSTRRLGPAGLALHYANIVNQIDNIVSLA